MLTSSEVIRANGFDEVSEFFKDSPKYARHLERNWHLYKYRSVDVDNKKSREMTRSLLVDEDIWFASASEFNDIFEMDFRIQLPGSKDFSEGLKRHAHLFMQMKLSPAKRLLHQQRTLRMQPVFTKEIETDIRKSIDLTLGLHCLSEDPRNDLLWSHYGGANKGFCIQYAVYADPIFFLANKVNYIDERVTVPFFSEKSERPQAHLYKKKVWSYEKEWRLAFLDVKGKMRLEKNSVVGVIVGAQASRATINLIRELSNERVKRGKVPLAIYQMVLDRETRRYKVFRM